MVTVGSTSNDAFKSPKGMTTMRPIRSIATALLVASVAVAGCATSQPNQRSTATGQPPAITAPSTTNPPQHHPPSAGHPPPPGAIATAISFMRREVGMTDPIAGAFRWTGARTGQVDIRAHIADDANPQRGPVVTVSLQRLSKAWYVLGVHSDAIRVVSPLPQDAIRSPLSVMAVANDRVRMRVTQDRYGTDLELGSGYLTHSDPTPDLLGTIAFSRPSAVTGSVVLTTTSGRNGEVWAATVVRVRFASGPPPQILGIRLSRQLPQQDGVWQLPAGSGTLTVRVTASHADRARLVYTPTGTQTAWYAKVVSQDTTAGNGLRLVWHYSSGDALGNVQVVVVGSGGIATRDLFSATTAPSKATPSEPVVLADGRHPVLLKSIDPGRRTITFDLIQMYWGDQATREAAKDHQESPPPNDYYIRNVDPKLRTLPVRADAPITVNTLAAAWTGSATKNVSVTLAKLATLRTDGAVFYITVRHDQVVKIAQQYLP